MSRYGGLLHQNELNRIIYSNSRVYSNSSIYSKESKNKHNLKKLIRSTV